MTQDSSVVALLNAVFKEQAALVVMDKLYYNFVVKMLSYQTGTSEAPTMEEFAEWRDAVDRCIEFSRLRGLIKSTGFP